MNKIDNDKNYSPENCRWTTREVQNRNRRLDVKRNKTGYIGVYERKDRPGTFKAEVWVNNKKEKIFSGSDPKELAIKRDKYIIDNGLEHTLNFDYHPETSQRGTWARDSIQIAMKNDTDYTDVTKDCTFYE